MSRGGLGGGRGSLLTTRGGRGALFSLNSASFGPLPSLGGGRGQILSQRNGSFQSDSSAELNRSGELDGRQVKNKSVPKDDIEDLENFKPMQEAYNDPNFNSYAGSGPGTLLRPSQHVNSRRESDVFKLHVANIPSSMQHRALENIFNGFGDVVSIFVQQSTGPTSWGFVEFRRLQEAQNAITDLDRQPPHNLSVKFAKEKVAQHTNAEDINTPYCKVETSNRGRKALPLHGTDPRKLQPKRSYNDRNTLESNGYENGKFSNYNPPADVEVNNRVMERTTSTAQCGKVVRGGRAYDPTPAVPKPKDHDPSFFQSVEKFKKPAHTEEVKIKIRNYIIKQIFYSKKEVNPPEVTCPFKQGNCTNCRAISATVCHVCKAWFCSYTCMENDWGKHKLVCRPKTVTFRPDGTIEYHEVPNDERVTRTKSHSPDFDENSHSFNQASNAPARRSLETEQRSHRRVVEDDKTEDEQPLKNVQPAKGEKTPPSSVQTKIDYAQHPPEPRDEGYVHTPKGLVTSRNAKYEANIHKRDLNDSQPVSQSTASAESAKSTLPTKPSSAVPATKKPVPEPPIPRGTFSDCLILYTSPEDEGLAVTPVAMAADQDEMMAGLSDYFHQPRDTAKVTEGSICGAKFVDDLWYRVEVRSVYVKTGVAKIYFIDFGNEDEIPLDGLKVLPDKFMKKPPMAFRVILVGGKKNYSINGTLTISPVKPTPCGSWLARTPDDPELPEEVEEKEALAEALPEGEEIIQEVPVKEESPTTSYPLSKDKFQIVTIMHVEEPGLFWVVTMEGMHGLLELNQSLDDSAKSKVKVTPEKNNLYNYFFSNIWCRALLINLDPVTVFFVDYGNAEEIDANGLLPLPLKLKSIPPLAIRIKLAEGTSTKNLTLQEMDTLNVRAHGKLSNAVLALVEGESYVQSVLDHEMTKAMEPVKPKKPNHVLSLLSTTSDAFVIIMKAMGEDFLCGSLQIANCSEPSFQSINDISQTLKTKKANPSYKPVVNDDVIVKINKDPRLYRGYVMSVEDEASNVALVDLGCVETPSKLAALPPEFKDIPPCGVRVSLHKPTSSPLSALLGSELSLQNIKITDEGAVADLGSYGQATITPWVPLLEEARIPAFKIDNKSQVMITAFHSPQAVYVRPLTPECIEAFSCVVQDVCAFCITAEPLQKPPLLGELVSARWNIDNNFYRALVSKKENKSFKVIFLDFGNIETAVLDDLRSLPDNFKKIPATVVKIGLKDVPGPLFNANATQLMNDVVAKETKFIVSHEGDLRNVVLTEESSGDVVNKILAQAMELSWVKNPSNLHTVPPYLNTDIRYDVWEEGVQLEGAVVGAPSHCDILFVNRSTLFEYIHNVMTPQMTKYCQEVQERAYNPRANEVVMAKFEGDWYRAVCTAEQRLSNDPTANVFFIDYGNMGEMAIEDMRKMVPEFVFIPAAVKHCRIYGLPRPESLSDDIKKKLTEALIEKESIELTVVKQFEGGNSVVWIPSLESTLTALSVPFTRPVGFS